MIIGFLYELKRIFTDKSVLLIAIIAPLFYSVYYPYPYSNQLVREIPVVAVDFDYSSMSRKLIVMLDETEEVQVIKTVRSQKEAEDLLNKGEVMGVMAIPKNFEGDIRLGKVVQVEALGNAGYFLIYSQTATAIAKAAGTLGAGIEMRRMQAKGSNSYQAAHYRAPLQYIIDPVGNNTGGYMSYVAPAILILILQQTLLIIMILRNVGKTSRLNLKQILSKSLAYATIYICHLCTYQFIVYPYLGLMQYANTLMFVLWSTLFLLLIIGWGWVLSLFFKRKLWGMQALVLSSLPLLFLTGFSWPKDMFSAPVYWLSELTPSSHLVPSFLLMNRLGASFSELSGYFIILGVHVVVIWTVFFLLKRYKRKKYGELESD